MKDKSKSTLSACAAEDAMYLWCFGSEGSGAKQGSGFEGKN